MAANADSVVVELIAKTDQLDAPIKQSATQFDASMNRIAASATKAETAISSMSARSSAAIQRESAQISAFSRSLSNDMIDAGAVLAAPTSPFVMPVKQGPAVANAMRVVTTGASLMGGVFEAVATGGVALLAFALIDFVSKLHEGNDELDNAVRKLREHYEQTRLNEQAQRIFDQTVEGSIDHVRRLTEELAKQNLTLEDNVNLKKAAIATALADVHRNIGATSSQLAAAVKELHEAQRNLVALKATPIIGDVGETAAQAAALAAAQARFDAARKSVADLTSQLNSLNGASAAARRGLGQIDFPLIERNAKDVVDPIAAINHHFDDLAAKAKQAGTYTQEFANALERQRKAALDAAEADKKLGQGLGGVQIDFAEATRIAKAAGLIVTSARRTTAEQAALFNNPAVNRPGNPVARPGTSAHEGVNGRWALDIAFAPGLTPQKVRKVFGDEGVSLSVVKKEAGHFHIEGSRSQALAQENAAARAAQQEMEREAAFAQAKDTIEQQILQAREQLGISAVEVAKFESAAADAAAKKYEDDVAAKQAQGKYTAAEAADLIRLSEERKNLIKEVIARRLQQQQFAQAEAAAENAVTFETGLLGAQSELLESERGLARTAQQRKQIEDRLIDIQFAEERIRLQAQIAEADRLKALAETTKNEQDIAAATKAEAEAAAARAKLANIPVEQANAHQQNAQQNASPLLAYLQEIPHTADTIDAALENVAVHGLDDFASGIADAIVNFHSLGDVARTVFMEMEKMLIELAVRMLIFKAFQAIGFAGLSGGGAVGMATGGKVRKFAPGGFISGPGGPTSDVIPIMASAGEFIIRTEAARKIGYGTLDYINRLGKLPRFGDGGMVRPMNATAVTGLSRGGFSGDDIRQLRGIVSDALHAMPDIALYPTLDPVDVLDRALGSPRGHRRFIAHIGANSTAIKATLNRPGG